MELTVSACASPFALQDGRFDVVANDDGFRTTPAWVSYTSETVVVGVPAKAYVGRNAANTISHVGRYLGCAHADVAAELKASMPKVKTQAAADGTVEFLVQKVGGAAGETEAVSPVDVAALLFKAASETAEAALGSTPKGVVVGTAAQWTDAQLAGLQAAAEKADLKVMSFLKAPLAAALAYELDNPTGGHKNAIVFDFGATVTATVLTVDGGAISIVHDEHSAEVGSKALDEKIVDHLAKDFHRKTKLDVKESSKSVSKLRAEAETARVALTTSAQVSIAVESLMEGVDFQAKLDRPKFEIMAKKTLNDGVDILEDAIDNGPVEFEEIVNVILVGGLSLVPKLQDIVESVFEESSATVHTVIRPDEAIAVGAARQAHLMAARLDKIDAAAVVKTSGQTRECKVLAKSLAVKIDDKHLAVVAPKGTPAPQKISFEMAGTDAAQTSVLVDVYETDADIKGPHVAHDGSVHVASLALASTDGKALDGAIFSLDIQDAGVTLSLESFDGSNKVEPVTLKFK